MSVQFPPGLPPRHEPEEPKNKPLGRWSLISPATQQRIEAQVKDAISQLQQFASKVMPKEPIQLSSREITIIKKKLDSIWEKLSQLFNKINSSLRSGLNEASSAWERGVSFEKNSNGNAAGPYVITEKSERNLVAEGLAARDQVFELQQAVENLGTDRDLSEMTTKQEKNLLENCIEVDDQMAAFLERVDLHLEEKDEVASNTLRVLWWDLGDIERAHLLCGFKLKEEVERQAREEEIDPSSLDRLNQMAENQLRCKTLRGNLSKLLELAKEKQEEIAHTADLKNLLLQEELPVKETLPEEIETYIHMLDEIIDNNSKLVLNGNKLEIHQRSHPTRHAIGKVGPKPGSSPEAGQALAKILTAAENDYQTRGDDLLMRKIITSRWAQDIFAHHPTLLERALVSLKSPLPVDYGALTYNSFKTAVGKAEKQLNTDIYESEASVNIEKNTMQERKLKIKEHLPAKLRKTSKENVQGARLQAQEKIAQNRADVIKYCQVQSQKFSSQIKENREELLSSENDKEQIKNNYFTNQMEAETNRLSYERFLNKPESMSEAWLERKYHDFIMSTLQDLLKNQDR